MNIFYKLLLTISALFLCTLLFAQNVSFSNVSNILSSNVLSYEDCVVDMNGDYLDDVVLVNQNGIYINYQQPNGTFTDSHFAMNLATLPVWSMCAGDIDKNGYNDLLMGGSSSVSFVYANDDGSAYTEDYHNEYIFSQRTTFADIDNDGHLDAFVCHDVDQSHPYRNDGTGVLTEDQSLIQTLNLAGNYAALWVDYDNDGDTDMYLTKCRQGSASGDPERTNAMYKNNGDGTYTDVGALIGLDDNAQSWATSFEDFDNDGDFDAFIVNHDEQNRFMINDGNGNFTESILSTGIDPNDLGAWENATGDFNNDGYIDILAQLNNQLYINNGDMTFTGQNLGFYSGGIGDLNNDGFLDVMSSSNLWMNNGNSNNWIKVNTEGIISNKNGIGSRVEIYGDWGVQMREVRAGESFSPMSSLTTHFGIGTATAIDSLVIKWPSGLRTVLENPSINTTYNTIEVACLLGNSNVTPSGLIEICEGESVELIAPENFQNYLWSSGESSSSITVTTPGVYDVTLTDANGCVSLLNQSVQVSLIQGVVPVVTSTGDNVFCNGNSITLISNISENVVWSNNETSQSITVSETGTYFVQSTNVCTGDLVSSDAIHIDVISPVDPQVESQVIYSPGPVTFNATGQNITWYDSPNGGAELGTGNSYTIPNVTANTTVYLESKESLDGELQNGGKTDNSGGGGLPSSGGHSLFNAFEPFTILSVTVYVPEGASVGNRTIVLMDENNIILDEKNVLLGVGQHDVALNFSVPIGNDFSLRCPENNLFRNNGGVMYPYPIGDVGEMTTSVYGGQYYYYFYDWKIELPSVECISNRVEANAYIYAVSNENVEQTISALTVYPNPTRNDITIQFDVLEKTELSLDLYDIRGSKLRSLEQSTINPGTFSRQLSLKDVAKGTYNIRVTANGEFVNKRIVVQ